MTTQREANWLKEAYRRAVLDGTIREYRELLRGGRVLRLKVERDYLALSPSKEPVVCDAVALAGQYQLRYQPTPHRSIPSKAYCVYARLDGSTDGADWVPVDGPWRVGDGPFDRR